MTGVERAKLVGVLGMLGSDQVGERAAAALLASRFLKAANLMWDEIIAPAEDAEIPSRRGDTVAQSARRQAEWALRNPGRLTPRDIEFLRTVSARMRPLTPKQAAWLRDIVGRPDTSQGSRSTAG